MAITRLNQLPEGSGNLSSDDLIVFMDNPLSEGATKKITVDILRNFIFDDPVNLQLRRGTESERLQTTPFIGEPIYTTDTKKLYLGDGATVGGNEIISEPVPQINPPGMARLVTIKNSGTFSATVKSTTGYVAVRWWDGSVQIFGAGISANNITVSKAAPTTGVWMKSAPKEIFIWSCTNGDANISGNLSSLSASSMNLTSLDINGLTSLTNLNVTSNSLTYLNAGGLTALTDLQCGSNLLTYLNLNQLTSLTSLTCNNNNLTSLNTSSLTSLTYLGCTYNSLKALDISKSTLLNNLFCQYNNITQLNLNNLTSLTTVSCANNSINLLSVNGLTSLSSLACSNNVITSLNLNGLTALRQLNAENNALSSIRAIGVKFGKAELYNPAGAFLQNNNLSGSALDQLYTDLDPNDGQITITGNPGVSTDNPSIAIAKGYEIIDS